MQPRLGLIYDLVKMRFPEDPRPDVSDPLDNPTPPRPPPPPHWKFWLTLVDPLEGGTPPPSPSPTGRGRTPSPPLPADKPQKVGKGGPLRTGRYSGILVP